MPRIDLILYSDPGQADIFCRIKLKNGIFEPLTAVVDTGAEISLFPQHLLNQIEYQLAEQSEVTIEQAGIAKQGFKAIEALITIMLEDIAGNVTEPFVIPAWFTETNQPLIGFAGVLDRGVLYVDMPKNTGWFEITI